MKCSALARHATLQSVAMKRCDWANQHEIFIAYHDEEWCVPCYEPEKLYEMLCLELMQAGLSWRLILEKRTAFNTHFKNFEPEKVANFTESKVEKLLLEPSIIRNRAKINAVINNAKQFLTLKKQGVDFSELVWSVVEGKPIVNQWKKQSDMPAKTKEAEQLTKLLKSYGFKFIGPTIAYSFMQAVGMVNDHLVSCYCYKKLS